MTALKLSVLGSFQVFAETDILHKFESNKVRALMAYLAVEASHLHSREMLAEMLWPESPTRAALANLRYALADLRKVIGDEKAKPPYLIVNRESLQFNPESDYELDAMFFEKLVNAGEIEKLKQGLALYRADFLAGFPSIESGSFEEWISLKREQFKRRAVEALRLLADHHAGRGEIQQALPYARLQVELEPWLEEAHQNLMRLLALDGQRSAALAQFESCRHALADELGVEPAPETIQLYEAIRDGTLEKVHHLLKREPPAPGDPPFKGLQYFDETDAGLFFGCEALVSHLVEQIRGRDKSKGMRFLAIIGASGSGKSSLVRAGLIPALKRADKSLTAQVITPTEHPLASLRETSDGTNLGGQSRGRIAPAARRLLFVDQFEELFTLCQNESERKSFIHRLLDIAIETRVVIALRADFYAACAPYENLRKILSQNQEYIGPMTAEELRRAIEEPAHVNGWLFEPGLTDLLLHDIGAEGERSPEPGALPLLSHALLETWHRRNGRMLTLAGYAETGKISQAITKTAEAVFTQFSAEEQSIARNIFLRLTELGDGTQETRRRVQLSEIVPPPELGKATTETVLKMLSDARLVITTEATAEVAHEALIREWDRLHEWLAENREGLRLHRHVTESAREWESHGHDAELAYRGARLAQALEWTQSHAEDLNLLEREFLEASSSLAEREAAEREATRQRELETARKLAESERQHAEGQTRAARQLRRRAYILAGILLLALVLAVAAFGQRNAASKQAHLAAARELALASINNLEVDAELSILLALQAVEESNAAKVPVPYEVQDALHRAIQNSRIQYTITGHIRDVVAVAYSPDGILLATAGSDKRAILWEATTGKELITLLGHSKTIGDIAFRPDGMVIATASDDKTVMVWDVATGRKLLTLAGHLDAVWNVSFSADGTLLATAGPEEAKVWDATTGQLLLTLADQHAPVAFSPLGKQLATSGDDGTTKILNVETEQELLSLPYAANALAFSPDGKYLATAMTELKVWELMTGKELFNSTGFTAPVISIGYNPDGSQLAIGGQDGTAALWEAQSGKRLFSLAGHAGAINDVAFSPQCVSQPDASFEWCGARLATAGRDGTVRLWDVSPGGSYEEATLPGFSGAFLDFSHLLTARFISPTDVELQTWDLSQVRKSQRMSDAVLSHAAQIIGGSISPDGKHLVTLDLDSTVRMWNTTAGVQTSSFVADNATSAFIAVNTGGTRVITTGDEGTLTVWDAVNGEVLNTLEGRDSSITGISISPDGNRIGAGYDDGTVQIWDLTTGKPTLTLTGHTMPVYTIAFSADGKRIATGGMDQTIKVWDAASGINLLTLTGHTASVLALAFSPDGVKLVSGSHDATMRLWDMLSGQELLTLTGHEGYIDSVMFGPTGKWIAAGSFQDGTVRVYTLDIAELVALARSRLTRSFTLAECRKYLHQTNCP